MASIATRTGDDGTTALLFGQRVAKDHPQVEAAGAFDELNVAIGAARAALTHPESRILLGAVQQNLVALMAEVSCAEADAGRYLASKLARLETADVERLDRAVADLEREHPPGRGWAMPGANPRSLALDQARVAARRAERLLASLPRSGRTVRPEVTRFANRLSDVLWLLARREEAGA
jgi:cob(I)alamin adenosyltransferase